MSKVNEKKKSERLGKEFIIKGWRCVITDYRSSTDITVTWQDGTTTDTTWWYVCSGTIAPPLMPSVVGIGINDLKRTSPERDPAYQKWVSMIKRSYCPKYHKNKPTYKDVEVCEEWKTYSNFLAWALQYGDVSELQLDKDFIGDGKLYSPENCMFIPHYLNSFLVKSSRVPTFTWKERINKYEVAVSKRILGLGTTGAYEGVYSTLEEATKVYWIAKKKLLVDILETMYKQDPLFNQEVYDKIMNSKWITQENPLVPIEEIGV